MRIRSPRRKQRGRSSRRKYVFFFLLEFFLKKRILSWMAASKAVPPPSPLLQPAIKPTTSKPAQSRATPTQSHPRQLHADLEHPLASETHQNQLIEHGFDKTSERLCAVQRRLRRAQLHSKVDTPDENHIPPLQHHFSRGRASGERGAQGTKDGGKGGGLGFR